MTGPSLTLRRIKAALVASAIGAVAFLLVVGTVPLGFGNVTWLDGGDPGIHYLGWAFFRRSAWGWPPGANPEYGLELSSGIMFSDSIPLLALPLKLLVPGVGPWQYFGAWLLLCFCLQGLFAALLAARYGLSARRQWAVALLFCFAPIFLWRLHGHFALNGQWLLLAALWLNLRPPVQRPWLAWLLLLPVAAMVHAYLLVMAAALWAADLARRTLWLRQHGWRAAALEMLGVALLVAGALWLGGFFMGETRAFAAGGFGQYSANLLTNLDSDGWSYFWPNLPSGAGQYEGLGFPGTGALALIGAALWLSLRSGRRWRLPGGEWLPLLAVLLALACYAFSGTWTVGSYTLFSLRLPSWIAPLAETLRASGRMIWPVTYAVLLLAIVQVSRSLPGPAGTVLLAGCALLQAADTSAGWRLPAERFTRQGQAWPHDPADPFWQQAGGPYHVLRNAVATGQAPSPYYVARLALLAGLPTDAVLLARQAGGQAMAREAENRRRVAEGRFEPGALYILDDVTAGLAQAAISPAEDLLVRLDGYNLLAPGWLRQAPPPAAARPVQIPTLPPLVAGQPLTINAAAPAENRAGLLYGWSQAEPAGVWSLGQTAMLAWRLPADLPENFHLRLEGHPLLLPNWPRQRLSVQVNGRPVASRSFEAGQPPMPLDIPLQREDAPMAGAHREVRLILSLPDAVSPSALGLSGDSRPLAFQLRRITLMPATD